VAIKKEGDQVEEGGDGVKPGVMVQLPHKVFDQ